MSINFKPTPVRGMSPALHTFKLVWRLQGTERVLVRGDGEVWLVRFPAVESEEGIRPALWYGFKAVQPRKRGAEFYARDNRTISPKPFRRLRDAITCGMAA